MRNHVRIVQIALVLAMIAVAIFMLNQSAIAVRGGLSSNHGQSFGPLNGNPGGQVSGDIGGTKGNPVIHPNVKPIKTERQCQRNCAKGGMTRDFCLLACAGY